MNQCRTATRCTLCTSPGNDIYGYGCRADAIPKGHPRLIWRLLPFRSPYAQLSHCCGCTIRLHQLSAAFDSSPAVSRFQREGTERLELCHKIVPLIEVYRSHGHRAKQRRFRKSLTSKMPRRQACSSARLIVPSTSSTPSRTSPARRNATSTP